MGLTPARAADIISGAVTWAVLDATLTASTPLEDVLATSQRIVEKVSGLTETSTERLQHCAVKSAAHAAACAKLLQGEAGAAPEAAATAAAKVGQRQKMRFHDVQTLAVSAAGRAATSNAMATCCFAEDAALQAGRGSSQISLLPIPQTFPPF